MPFERVGKCAVVVLATLLVGVTAVALVGQGRRHASASDAAARGTPVPPVATPVKRATGSAPPVTADPTACVANSYDQYVLVSISRQHAWMCAGGQQVYSTAVTTGATVDDDRTPTGSWQIQDKQTDRDLVGPGYRDHVQYWMPFWGDFGFHDATWQTFPFGGPQWQTEGSHGCVHLPTRAMAWLYSWARVGATVTVQA
ncbi:MAG TPA: L,D-transpeptidase [Jatrophihabitantaceae bacterium]|jgi:lipoprotein-anchoring transpeptidase ErfK/SrfK|nr:L,D-transpeptidase [Jatrophihabitantaceae bacterium]